MSRRIKKHEDEPVSEKMGTPETVRDIAERTGVSMYKVRQVLKAYNDVTREALTHDRKVSIHGIGILYQKELPETTNYIPSKGEYVTTPARKTVAFKPSETLRRDMNPEPPAPAKKKTRKPRKKTGEAKTTAKPKKEE